MAAYFLLARSTSASRTVFWIGARDASARSALTSFPPAATLSLRDPVALRYSRAHEQTIAAEQRLLSLGASFSLAWCLAAADLLKSDRCDAADALLAPGALARQANRLTENESFAGTR
jgi:hypothetical protein